ncbi:MAG: DUF6526 family protein [Vicinamibacterales bacterium]|jgi:hypothetical protein
MAQAAQNYKNHTRFYPPFHFFVMPVLLIHVINEGRHVWANPNRSTGFALLLALALVMLALTARGMALKVQDRVIRFEMYARMRELLPADLVARMTELTPQQLVALRFAGDAELAELVRDVFAGKLTSQKAIKLQIKHWKGDYLRA